MEELQDLLDRRRRELINSSGLNSAQQPAEQEASCGEASTHLHAAPSGGPMQLQPDCVENIAGQPSELLNMVAQSGDGGKEEDHASGVNRKVGNHSDVADDAMEEHEHEADRTVVGSESVPGRDKAQDAGSDAHVEGNESSHPPAGVTFDLESSPGLLTSLTTPFGRDNFTKGCKWSPDGTCLLVCSEDNTLRVLNLPSPLFGAAKRPDCHLPEPPVVFSSFEGELVYDYTWFPLMDSLVPPTCCYASSSRDHPIHLFDAFDGALRCSYRAYNSVDEISAAYSITFDPWGERLYAGFDGWMALFDVSRPGRQILTRKTKEKKSLACQPGIISCITFCPANPDLYAAGTYLRSIGLYSATDGTPVCLLQGQTGGVTHIKFSPDGTKLFTGGRKDPEILCWDLRNLGGILYTAQRKVTTNQRVYFDLSSNGKYLVSGDCEGCVQVWDTELAPDAVGQSLILPSVLKYRAHTDCCNGISIHPWLPVVSTSSGQRHLDTWESSDEDVESGSDSAPVRSHRSQENSVKLWWLGS